VVEVIVVVEQEREAVRQHHPVRKCHSGHEENRCHDDEPDDHGLALVLERRGEERPDLPDEDRNGERNRSVESHRQGSVEWFPGAQGDEPRVARERPLEPVDDVFPKGVRKPEGHAHGEQRNDQAGA